MTEEDFDEAFRLAVAEIQLGEEATDFLKSPIGQIVMARAEEEKAVALESMAKIKPWSPFARAKLKDAQFKHAVAANFLQWIDDVLIDAHNARQRLESPS